MSPERRRAALPSVLVFTTMVASIVSSLGAPLIPAVASDFHESLSTAQWSLTVALLSGAVSAPVLGRLGDGPRRRATMLGALAAVTLGGVIAGLASGLDVLVVGRALQGVGLGLAPLTMAAARDELPRDRVAYDRAAIGLHRGWRGRRLPDQRSHRRRARLVGSVLVRGHRQRGGSALRRCRRPLQRSCQPIATSRFDRRHAARRRAGLHSGGGCARNAGGGRRRRSSRC